MTQLYGNVARLVAEKAQAQRDFLTALRDLRDYPKALAVAGRKDSTVRRKWLYPDPEFKARFDAVIAAWYPTPEEVGAVAGDPNADLPVSQARVWACMHYDPGTGDCFNKVLRSHSYPGKRLGTVNAGGYVVFHVDGHLDYAHRWARVFMRGDVPQNTKHRDEDPTNNAWANLMETTNSEHHLPRTRLQSNNTTGYRGVAHDTNRDQYIAQLSFERRRLLCKRFETALDAAIAYDEAVIRHGLADRLPTNSALGRLPPEFSVLPSGYNRPPLYAH